MIERFCPDCGCNKPIEEFAFKNKARGTRQAYCNEHRRAREKSRYQRIKATVISKVRERQAEYKREIDEWKLQFSCAVCGEDDSCCIDFHHRDPSEKEMGISQMKMNGYTLARVQEEAAKCVPLCANCHRKVHAGVITL